MKPRREVRLQAPVNSLNNEALRIDRETLRVYGSVAALANVEALGHGLWSDHKTIETLAALGNQAKFGIRMRFGHPGMSENAMGRKVGKAFNFRVEGDKLLHDIRLLAPADNSPVLNKPVSYILDMAEQHPEEIAESVVIEIRAMWVLADGRELDDDDPDSWPDDVMTEKGRPVNATTPYPVIRPMTFYYTDFVAEGALTHDGLFSMSADDLFIGSSRHIAQIFEVMDDARITYGLTSEDMRRKALAIFSTYEAWRQGETTMPNELEKHDASGVNQPDATPVAQPVNLDKLVAESTELATKVNGENPEPQYVSIEEHQAVVVQLNTLTEAYNALIERFNQLASVFQNQQSILTKLTQQQARTIGEPIVTMQVPVHAEHAHGLSAALPDLSVMRNPPSLAQKLPKGSNNKAETAQERALRLNASIAKRTAKI